LISLGGNWHTAVVIFGHKISGFNSVSYCSC